MRSPSVHIRLGSDTHPADERLALWSTALGFSHEVVVRPQDRLDFWASLDGYHLGPILFADMRVGRHTAIRTRATIARHTLDALALDVFLDGSLKGRFGGNVVSVGPGDALLLDVRETMHIELTDHRCLTLVVPRALFAERVKVDWPIGGRVLPAASPQARLLAGQLERWITVAPDLSDPLAEAAGLVCVDLLAACFAPSPVGKGGERSPRGDPPERRRIERFIARNAACADLGPEMVSAHFRLSRSAVYRLLQPVGGVAALARRHRAAAAHRLLTSERGRDLSIGEVAQRCGFNDAQALRRALRDTYDASPRQLRTVGPSEGGLTSQIDLEVSAWIDADPS